MQYKYECVLQGVIKLARSCKVGAGLSKPHDHMQIVNRGRLCAAEPYPAATSARTHTCSPAVIRHVHLMLALSGRES